jgi:hypothetical protein
MHDSNYFVLGYKLAWFEPPPCKLTTTTKSIIMDYFFILLLLTIKYQFFFPARISDLKKELCNHHIYKEGVILDLSKTFKGDQPHFAKNSFFFTFQGNAGFTLPSRHNSLFNKTGFSILNILVGFDTFFNNLFDVLIFP